MSAGVYVNGRHPKTKKALKDQAKSDPSVIAVEVLDFGRERGYTFPELPEFQTFFVCGPDPHTDRKWYAEVTRQGETLLVK